MGGVVLRFDPNRRTPTIGFNNCIDRIQACDALTKSRDACVAAAPRCTSQTPWLDDPGGVDCCPSECLLEYFNWRQNTPPGPAMVGMMHSFCYPGLREYLQGLR